MMSKLDLFIFMQCARSGLIFLQENGPLGLKNQQAGLVYFEYFMPVHGLDSCYFI